MMTRNGLLAITMAGLALVFCGQNAWAERPLAETKAQAALDDLHQWVGEGSTGQGWRKFLKSELLSAQLAKGELADGRAVSEILAQYESGKPGLDRPRFQAVREALVAWNAGLLQIAPQELAKAARDATGSFQPVTPQDVGQAKAELVAAISDLERFINRSGPANSAAWKNFLRWNDLVAAMQASDAPPAEVLADLVDRYTSNELGLELPQFTRVRIALQNYAATTSAAADAKLQEQYALQLEDLAKQLEAYAQDPAGGDAAIAVGRALGWLQRNRQAKELVGSVRQANSRHNLYGYASRRLVAAGIEDDISETQPIRDNILGTSLFGTAHLTGRTTLVLAENPQAAGFQVLLNGQANSNNVGYNRGVTIYTTGVTQVSGTKYLQMNAAGMTHAPATACCETHSNINGICAKGPLVERIAWKKAGKSQGSAEAVASDHAEIRVANQMNERSAKLVKEQNDRYIDKFRNPLLRRGHFPRDMNFSSHPDRAELRMLQDSISQIASPTEPPPVEATHDLAVRAHESMVVNFGEASISGYEMTDLRLEKLLRDDLKSDVPPDLQVTLPDGKLDPDKEPWALQFARELPVRAKFNGGKVWIAIRADAFFRGQDDLQAKYNKALDELIEISADYTIERTEKGATLRRQGDVVVSFPNAKEGERSARRTGASAFLKVKFRNLFKEEFVGEGLAFKGRWERAGKLQLQEINSDAAWLTLGWKLPPPGTVVPEAAPPAAATPAAGG